MKTERTQIHFLSDVLVAVASLDLKVCAYVPFLTEVLRAEGKGICFEGPNECGFW